MNAKEKSRQEYTARINRVTDYIEQHLDEAITLDSLAQIACFSPFHFHRIFTSITKEPLFKYIQRLRLEKAAFLLISNRKKTIAEIALDCGFSNQACFSRAFRNQFEKSAGHFRSEACCPNSKECKTESNPGKEILGNMPYNKIEAGEAAVRPIDITVTEIAPFTVAYIRHTGPYKKDAELFSRLFRKLYKWANARDLTGLPGVRWLTIYHCDPGVTVDQKLRISVCLTVPKETPVDGAFGKMEVPGGKYAIARFVLRSDQYQQAWDYLFNSWLMNSGYQPDDKNSFELYPYETDQREDGNTAVHIYLPVIPL
jgi:AraC family transcriptional regulator